MNFLYRCFLATFMVSICFYSYAQTGFVVSGKVSTENGISAGDATVTLLRSPDSAVVKTTICTQAGHFRFDFIKPGSYFILVHKLGYKRFYTQTYNVADGDLTINTITLLLESSLLKEVTITG